MTNGAKDLPATIAADLVTLYADEKWSQLVIAARQVITDYPQHPLGWKAAGKALMQLGKMQEALEILAEVVNLAPGESDGHTDLGNALHALGRSSEAVACCRRAVELSPHLAEAHSNLGRVLCGLGRFEEAAACCQVALGIDPNSSGAHNNLGNALRETGRLLEAEASYSRALALTPGSVDILINRGTVLSELGRWNEAEASLRRSVALHANSDVAHSALGGLISRLGRDDEAMLSLERAIVLNASNPDTYIALGNILVRKQQTDAALVMFQHAKKLRLLTTWRANQEQADFSVVFLDTPIAGSTPVDYLAGRACYDRHFYCVVNDTLADVDLLRSKADVVFNMVCNADNGRDVLVHALDLVQQLGRPTINHPQVIMNTDRAAIARRLADIPHCVTPRTVRVAGSTLLKAALNSTFAGFELPLLARVAGPHGGEDFDKFHSWADVARFVDRTPEADYYVIDYVDYRSADGYFRKYRVIFVDGDILPYHLAIHDDWKVHHYRTSMAETAWMRTEEEQFLTDMASVFDADNQIVLRAIARATGLDYGGIDCGLDQRGQIVVFEANASMLVHAETNETFIYKNPHIAKIKAAFDAMLSRRRMIG